MSSSISNNYKQQAIDAAKTNTFARHILVWLGLTESRQDQFVNNIKILSIALNDDDANKIFNNIQNYQLIDGNTDNIRLWLQHVVAFFSHIKYYKFEESMNARKNQLLYFDNQFSKTLLALIIDKCADKCNANDFLSEFTKPEIPFTITFITDNENINSSLHELEKRIIDVIHFKAEIGHKHIRTNAKDKHKSDMYIFFSMYGERFERESFLLKIAEAKTAFDVGNSPFIVVHYSKSKIPTPINNDQKLESHMSSFPMQKGKLLYVPMLIEYDSSRSYITFFEDSEAHNENSLNYIYQTIIALKKEKL